MKASFLIFPKRKMFFFFCPSIYLIDAYDVEGDEKWELLKILVAFLKNLDLFLLSKVTYQKIRFNYDNNNNLINYLIIPITQSISKLIFDFCFYYKRHSICYITNSYVRSRTVFGYKYFDTTILTIAIYPIYFIDFANCSSKCCLFERNAFFGIQFTLLICFRYYTLEFLA